MNNIINIRSIAHQYLKMPIKTVDNMIPILNVEFDTIVHPNYNSSRMANLSLVVKSATKRQKKPKLQKSPLQLTTYLSIRNTLYSALESMKKKDIVFSFTNTLHTIEVKLYLKIIGI